MAFVNDPTPAPVYQPLPLIWVGVLQIATSPVLVPCDSNYVITGVRAAAGTPAVGSPIVLDLLANGTSVFTTTANRPTIAAGSTLSAVTVPDITSLTENTLLQMAVLSVGSTTPGANVCMVVSLQRS